MIRRRELLQAAAGFLLLRAVPSPARSTGAFDYAQLQARARALAETAYRLPERELPEPLLALDYDRYQAIRFRPERALWAKEGLAFRAQFFHRGFRIRNKVRIHEVVDGAAREIAYDPALYDLRKAGLADTALPGDLGFAGLRFHYRTDWNADIAVFLDASYFRAVGASGQYGLSARGLAIDTGAKTGEEFPVFTEFWLVRPRPGDRRVTLYALLDSKSIAGAYRFEIAPGEPLVMEVDAALYPRAAIQTLGIAPLTSMYYCGENDRLGALDWRPEIHDSDGLALHAGTDRWLWRPLVNPDAIRLESLEAEDPRGFGLLQRDRALEHYQDDGARYHARPGAWVEPHGAHGGWGRGAVQLMEMPAPEETVDNVVAFWNPAEPVQPGRELQFSYRLSWGEKLPVDSRLARVVATRSGIGGNVGQKRDHFSWRFVVDFAGGRLAHLPRTARVVPVISISRGESIQMPAWRLAAVQGYRAMFDVRPADAGTEPIDLSLLLQLDGQPLTETWSYRWTPPPLAERDALVRKVNSA